MLQDSNLQLVITSKTIKKAADGTIEILLLLTTKTRSWMVAQNGRFGTGLEQKQQFWATVQLHVFAVKGTLLALYSTPGAFTEVQKLPRFSQTALRSAQLDWPHF